MCLLKAVCLFPLRTSCGNHTQPRMSCLNSLPCPCELLHRAKGRLGTTCVSVGCVWAVRESEIMNRALRRALVDADLTEVDVAARLDVDPKTVRAWVSGRVPYPHNRRRVAKLVGRDETDLWPEVD